MNYFELVLGIAIGIILDILWGTIAKRRRKGAKTIFLGFRLHHSVSGIFLIIIGIIFNLPFITGIGIGVIISHTIRTKELMFIEKEK